MPIICMLHKVCLCPCARVCARVAWVNVCVRVCLRVCERSVFLLEPSDLKQPRSAPVIVHTTSHCHCNYTFVAWRQKRKASWRRLALKLYDARITARVRAGCQTVQDSREGPNMIPMFDVEFVQNDEYLCSKNQHVRSICLLAYS